MMDPIVCQQLLDLNRRFYTQHADDFSATRQRLQPGVLRVLARLGGQETILDLGCGNGLLAQALSQRHHQGAYLGLDFSPSLLKEAKSRHLDFPADFRAFDLADAGGLGSELPAAPWSWVTAFALLHHIPGSELRARIWGRLRDLLKPGGLFLCSNWQFLRSAKWRARLQPWEQAGLKAAQVEPNDYLLDWRSGGRGLRYVHHFDEDELARLAQENAFQLLDSFRSDGEGGQMSLYQVWQKI